MNNNFHIHQAKFILFSTFFCQHALALPAFCLTLIPTKMQEEPFLQQLILHNYPFKSTFLNKLYFFLQNTFIYYKEYLV